jgi:hypothetical protein
MRIRIILLTTVMAALASITAVGVNGTAILTWFDVSPGERPPDMPPISIATATPGPTPVSAALPAATRRGVVISAEHKFYDLDSGQADLGYASALTADSDIELVPWGIYRANNKTEIAMTEARSLSSCNSSTAWTTGQPFEDASVGKHICVNTGKGYFSITFEKFKGWWPSHIETVTVTITRW